MFEPRYPLKNLRPASYNPRRIDGESIETLKESLRELGLVKPVIVTTEGTIVAGHQRTKGMSALGWTHCPAFVLPPINTTDEIRFNQLHNASDLDAGAERVHIPLQEGTGFRWIAPEDLKASALRVPNAAKKTEMLRLMSKYGDWGCCVATQSGEVLVSGLYALCCKIVNRPCLACVIPDDRRELAERYFGREYGVFSYEHLPRTTWAQSLAQMMRLRETQTGRLSKRGDPKGKSRTYENLVIPRLKKGLRILDFGAGQMDYVKKLKAQGADIHGVEFYVRKGRLLDTPRAHRDIDALCKDLERRGLFDMVVCDSVLNSVDTLQAESDVLTCLNALCKSGGMVVFSGRTREKMEYREATHTTNTDAVTRYVNFFDEHGFSAMYANGVWRYQKFHTLPEIHQLARSYFGREYRVYTDEGSPAQSLVNCSGWGVVAIKRRILALESIEGALSREFDLPLPDGQSFGRSADILRSWRKAKGGRA
jgi:ParB family chromosome partitioning protein